MTDLYARDELLRAQDGNAGCDAGVPIMEQYVAIELQGGDRANASPGTAIYLRVARAAAGITTACSSRPARQRDRTRVAQ